MPNFIMNIRRITKPGQEGALVAAAIETLNGANTPGNVSIDISTAVMSDPAVTNALQFDTLSDVEQLHDAALGNPESELIQRFYATNALASKVTTTLYRIIDPVELGPDDQIGMLKYMSRTLLMAKRGEASNVLNVVREVRSNRPGRKPMINMAVLGNPDLVRIVRWYRSLEELEMEQARMRENEEYKTALGQLAGLTTMVRQTLARAVHFKQ
jgi:hypothetical protein